MPPENFLIKFAKSNLKSLASSELKKQVKGLISKQFKKSDVDIAKEVLAKVGYPTEHFTLDKKQNVVFKPSMLMAHEWMTTSPHVKSSIIRDEENGQVYIDNKIMDNTSKLKIVNQFVKDTSAKNAAVVSYFDRAFKHIDVSDFTSIQFQNKFSTMSVQSGIIDGWLTNCFGLKDTEEQPLPYVNMLFRKWIVGTAQRIITPGSSLDGCLTLQGPTNIGKTLFFRLLMPEQFNSRTGEVNCDLKNPQKLVESIIGKSIACFDELSVLEHENVKETFKSLLSQQFIDVRMPWERQPRRYKLRQGFGGTTNKDKFINDPSMFRRLWTISLKAENKLNFDYLNANKDKLWAEAVSLVKSENSYLSQVDQSQVEKYNHKFLLDQSPVQQQSTSITTT